MKPAFFSSNRNRLSELTSGGIIVIAGHASMQAVNDTAARFQQESNFWWLCGIEAPDWGLIIDGTRHKSWLVAPKVSENHEIFDGSLSPSRAKQISGVDEVMSSDEAIKMLRDLARRHSMVYTLGDHPYAEYMDFTFNPAPKKMYDQLERTFNSVQDCRPDLTTLRAIKQPDEIAAIKKAVALTVKAFDLTKRKLPNLNYEYEVEAEFSYYFRRHAASNHAYEPIVASGKNACTLHYVDNSSKLKPHQLLLLDVGVRYNGYAADISRTYAIGSISKRQKDVHRVVSEALFEIIELLRPGKSIQDFQKDVNKIMAAGLLSLGLIKDSGDRTAYRRYFPHAVSHGLGVDVHDSLGAPKVFEPGMVLTVEPGIYITNESIGVRIEDDILITKTGYNNLSKDLSTDW